ncbi:hypothetical protein HNO51_19040 [Billgrantia sulfidoxydans]|uniref:Uncharacterized protein n=1 Tax=Billgrantia sulfidoxydans TaxID=2733484 RepID=A0ABX7WC66_9GAMM|nr:hypothetical protein [Halomonas sulfidoxydans]QTP56594.1 hypothetical protein HNO51_19040 [Halomonas sulfidoxydans]
MPLTRRQLLRNGLLVGAAAPFTLGAAWASQAGSLAEAVHGEITLYGDDRSAAELGAGLRQKGWVPRYAGGFDPLALAALPNDSLAAGVTDEAGLVLLTSLLAGRGRILALGRHVPGGHRLLSHRGRIMAPLVEASESWQAALGREYARLALNQEAQRSALRLRRADVNDAAGGEALSFLVRL